MDTLERHFSPAALDKIKVHGFTPFEILKEISKPVKRDVRGFNCPQPIQPIPPFKYFWSYKIDVNSKLITDIDFV